MKEEEVRKRQEEREDERLRIEKDRFEAEQQEKYEGRRFEEDRLNAERAGPGSGGYIVVEMPEAERPLFHDLLKGFEDYAKLKGYEIAFSIDSSMDGHIAFKFTVKNDGIVVGSERVRRDFKEYMENVRNGQADDLDHLPVITNLEEHNLVVTMLKNRISFLQHRYQLSRNAVQFYEGLIANVRSFPALPAPSVIVQTGGTMDSGNYKAINSPSANVGHHIDSSVNIDIGQSFNDRQARIDSLNDVISQLDLSNIAKDHPVIQKAQRELGKVRDEIAESSEPDKSSVKKWLENAKNLMGTATLGLEVTEAARKLFELFGVS